LLGAFCQTIHYHKKGLDDIGYQGRNIEFTWCSINISYAPTGYGSYKQGQSFSPSRYALRCCGWISGIDFARRDGINLCSLCTANWVCGGSGFSSTCARF
jgi:hypothetical protein